MGIRILVDADSCASKAKKFILKTAKKKGIQVIFAANKNIPFGEENPLFKMVICSQDKDSADDYLVENSADTDIVVTRDLILASRLLKKNVSTMNDMGTIFDSSNIDYLLEERELGLQMKSLGISNCAKWNSYGEKEVHQFITSFWSVFDRLSGKTS